LEENAENIKRPDVAGGFGNHRKYESLSGSSLAGTGTIVASYVDWVMELGSHRALIDHALKEANGDPKVAFDLLYKSMSKNVYRFGRLAKFDYLTMLGKLGLAPIEAASTYLTGATGPLSGARLLFGKKLSPKALDQMLIHLDLELNVGMQVLEDSLCNWQKSPNQYRYFGG